ncbi:MAG: glycosyltransferase [Candidatus Woesebacteria bacterium]|jgi:glycosyltransferase involved in cell wall biosynthesis
MNSQANSQELSPKIALVYDRVNTAYGGAEKVLLALQKAFPQAPLYTSVYHKKRAFWAKNFDVRTSFLQKFSFAKKYHRCCVAFMPLAFESLDLSNFDVVISITSAEAKGVITNSKQLHICYLLTPTRYLYSHRQQYLDSKKIFKIKTIRFLAKKILDYLNTWDQVASSKPDLIIPISNLIAKRCKKYYRRQAEKLIYPPVGINKKDLISNSAKNKKKQAQALKKLLSARLKSKLNITNFQYFLVLSRLVPYKKIDLAIKACLELKKNLIIVGDGPEKNNLEKIVKQYQESGNVQHGAKIIFLGHTKQKDIALLFQYCQALLMPGIEDFGITALEANAYGKPVIINQESGAAELILNKKHGLHLKKETSQELISCLKNIEKYSFNTKELKKNAAKYGTTIFIRRFRKFVKLAWQKKNKNKGE